MQELTDPKAVKLAEYMQEEFGVTPENIDEKLKELEVEFYEKLNRPEKVAI